MPTISAQGWLGALKCFPRWTQAQCDNYALTGDPSVVAGGTPTTPDGDGIYWSAGYGRFTGLTIQQAAKFFWKWESLSVDLTSDGRPLAGDLIPESPLKRLCLAPSAIVSAGSMDFPEDLIICGLNLVKIAFNTETEDYEVFWEFFTQAFYPATEFTSASSVIWTSIPFTKASPIATTVATFASSETITLSGFQATAFNILIFVTPPEFNYFT